MLLDDPIFYKWEDTFKEIECVTLQGTRLRQDQIQSLSPSLPTSSPLLLPIQAKSLANAAHAQGRQYSGLE